MQGTILLLIFAATTVRFGVVILWVDSMATFVDYGVESVLFVCCIFYSSDCTIRIVDSVRSLEDVSIAVFVLAFYVTGVVVFNSIIERVFWMCL